MQKKLMVILVFVSALIFILAAGSVSALTDCWSATNSASQTVCEANADCKWHSDPWGNWCEQKGCWNFYDTTSCGESNTAGTPNYINKSCNWRTTSTGWCMETDCWSLSGTSESQCEVEAYANYSLNCTWSVDPSDYPCNGPPEKSCWNQVTETTCTNITGCSWGMCDRTSCWDQTTAAGCTAAVGYNGNSCIWNAQYSYCYESGCWDHSNKTACDAASCKWSGGYCSQQWCSDFGYKNESYCEQNTVGLNCQWNNPWCEEVNCWTYNSQNNCIVNNSSSGTPCLWQTYDGGWCEEVGCWNWDSWAGGTEATCLSNGVDYKLNCVWGNDTWTAPEVNDTDGWCYQDVSTKSCGDIIYERDCIDTMYCFWNYSSSACLNPIAGTIETGFVPWYPNCYIFDMVGESACGSTTNCTWVAGDYNPCRGNTTEINSSDPLIGGLRCEYINDSGICNNMTMLPRCCEWQGGTCTENKFTTQCWDQMAEVPEGATYCEDYNSFTDQSLCEQIAGGPWYLPCKWDNKSTSDKGDDRCVFKSDQVFEEGKENLIYLDSQKACGSAGGKWIVDMYASSTDPDTAVALPMGHCEENFGGKRNCNSDCYACDYKEDGTNFSSSQKAETACYASLLGICGFNSDASAPNGFGYCKPKEEFKKGIAKDCDDDCGSCTFMGSPTAAEAVNRPSTYCTNSKVTGGCRWAPDLDYPTDESKGRCAKKAEKSCEDKCDLCTSETHCTNFGKKKGNTTLSTQCSWSDTTNTCSLTSGGDQMEICWDGTDNNNNGKMDCADSQCFSDSFCGGGFMAGFGGQDCFGSDTQTECEAAGCAWINENWGSWCDMPGANCWSNDGDAAACGLDGNCTWHDGFGGFCEENWTMVGSSSEGCMSYNESNCVANETRADNCTWVVDSFYNDMGGNTGWCDPNPNYNWATGGSFVDCVSYDTSGQTACEAAGTVDGSGARPCMWFVSGGGAAGDQAYAGGWCDHRKFACWQFHEQSDCTNQTNATYNHSEYCIWKQDEWGSWCEGKMMGGTGSTDSCWNKNVQNQCTDAGCNWVSGFCDPVGFGSEAGFGGMAGGTGFGGGAFGSFGGGTGGFATMGGSGMNCMQYDGDQTGCSNSSGCSWMKEKNPSCGVDFSTSCPQYSYSKAVCESKPRCTYNDNANFCDEKAFMCFWNSSFSNGVDDPNIPGVVDQAECNGNELCNWTSWGTCEPICFGASAGTQVTCEGEAHNATNETLNQSACRWVTGWCNSGMTTQFFKKMEGGAPIPLGTDARGDVEPPEVDIVSYGMKDMGSSFGFGITVDNVVNSSMCNGVKLNNNVTGKGYNASKFYWYLDTDGTSTGGCTTRDSNAIAGFEFYFKGSWTWGSNSVTESLEAYKCSSGSWKKASIPLTSFTQKACTEVGGGMVAVEKAELEKFSSLYTTGGDMRIYVATANVTGNVTDPTDTISSAAYGTPSAYDQDIDKLNLFTFKNTTERIGEGLGSGYVTYTDIDCWSQAGCADYQCAGHPYCVNMSYGVEAAGFTDTRVPKIVGMVKETYSDSALIKFWTDKPSNASLEYFGPNDGCPTWINNPYPLVYSTNNLTGVRNFTLEHMIELTAENLGGMLAAAGATEYFKLTFCDEAGKCGISKCSKIIYEDSIADPGPFAFFVAKIEAPSSWNVSFDIDQDGVFEHHQNAFEATTNKSLGIKVNYTEGRRTDIRLFADDNSSWIEFSNATLTKTGMSSTIRDVDDSGDLMEGTTTDSAGNTLGYVGMIEETRDQIVHNMYPQKCTVKFPEGDTGCTELWHCNDDNSICLNRTAEATLIEDGEGYCIWEIPYCQFSNWGGGQPGSGSSSSSSSSSGGGGGSSSSSSTGGGETAAATPVSDVKKEEAAVAEEAVTDKVAGELLESVLDAFPGVSADKLEVSPEFSVEEKVELTGTEINLAVEAVAKSETKEELRSIQQALNTGESKNVAVTKKLTVYKVTEKDSGESVYRSKVELIFTAAEDSENLVFIEVIPKSFAQAVSEVSFLGEKPAVLESDPVVKWEFASVRKGEVKEMSYVLKKKVDKLETTTIGVASLAKEGKAVAEPSRFKEILLSYSWLWLTIVIIIIAIGIGIYIAKKKNE